MKYVYRLPPEKNRFLKQAFAESLAGSPLVSRRTVKIIPKESRYTLDFNEVYQNNLFAGDESLSGRGSNLSQTIVLRRELVQLLDKYSIKTFLDLPCGDFNWMKHINFGKINYIGGDIVESLVAKNREQFGDTNHKFFYLDLISSALPAADVMFCRDCLVHLNYIHIYKALKNLKKSKIKYFMSTTFTAHNNEDLSYIWRPLNLQQPPFCFPVPLDLINEECPEGDGEWADKCIGVWETDHIPLFKNNPADHDGMAERF